MSDDVPKTPEKNPPRDSAILGVTPENKVTKSGCEALLVEWKDD